MVQYNWNNKKRFRVSLVTACMGRLYHLKETILKNIEANKTYPNIEFILLDYNSPDSLENWARVYLKRYIDQKLVYYYKTTQPRFFHMSHAKNVAHLLATGDIVSNVDADNLVSHGYAEHLNDMFLENGKSFCRCSRSGDNGTGGRVAMMRKDFIRIGGYEESMIGWGYEDADLVLRARRHHLSPAFSHSVWCKAIQHDDASRERYHTPPTQQETLRKSESVLLNRNICESNRRQQTLYGNTGRAWGVAKVLKNFLLPMEVSSALLVKETRRGPLAMTQPKEKPDVVDDPREPEPPKVEEALPPKPKTFGYFTVSAKPKIRSVTTTEPQPKKKR